MSSVGPLSGSSEGGTDVVVKGTGFLPGATVTIGGAASAVEVISETEIEAVTPAHASGLEEVVVSTVDGESTGGPGYTYVSPLLPPAPPPPPPMVSSISPVSGSSEGGTKVLVTGTGFLRGATVAIGGAASAVEVISETELEAVTRPNAPGSDEVVVTTAAGESRGGPSYTYVPPPKVSSVSPVSGPTAGGTPVRVMGSNFGTGAKVQIGGVASAVEVISETELKAVTPAHGAGPQEVVVSTGNGGSSGGPSYTYVAPPKVSSIEPASGTSEGGTPVRIKGSGFVEGVGADERSKSAAWRRARWTCSPQKNSRL